MLSLTGSAKDFSKKERKNGGLIKGASEVTQDCLNDKVTATDACSCQEHYPYTASRLPPPMSTVEKTSQFN